MREFHAWLVVWAGAGAVATVTSESLPLRGIGLVIGTLVGLSAAYNAGRTLRRDRDARATR